MMRAKGGFLAEVRLLVRDTGQIPWFRSFLLHIHIDDTHVEDKMYTEKENK